ncbi:hypothetical protein [Actinophytocola algeriensis]|uniref:Uncharacterized membrane protein YgaE (UPF0421/DUF939 family) n=1 Tax=Actinophytocola algeriensis TaxID=1768010 RepID=A0A7W7Q3X0_9PSEU|nr:hypothetical protein [Actinophytocola algeriensis]MBB4906363.1 uncharacterized membrane protein YgaE (UPF0421/DUF939 family) [Actinophytocola algeriensis]MBE1477844.1 uncharacterized membrane protein YgaE (UPF0421/DUF939 family) [Actinophytocola algeriensis]
MNIVATLVRLVIGGGLAAVTFAQMGISPTALLVVAFLVTVAWSRLSRQGVA